MLATDTMSVASPWIARGAQRRTADKLRRELPTGALVIDYTNNLASWGAFGPEPKHTVHAPVSWNAGQNFYIWKKK